MAQFPLFRCQKPVSSTAAAVTPIDGGAASGASRQCLSGCGGIGRRLVRKLKKQSKMFCTAAAVCGTDGGAATSRCQYDPLSYSRNFDGCCALDDDDDSSHFYYTFSSRFARPLAASH